MENLKALGDRVIVKRHEAEAVSAGGIILSEGAVERPVFANVLAVGPGLHQRNGTLEPLTVRPGDVVLVAQYGGQDINHEGQRYTVLPECDIIAIRDAA